ncbi:3-oxoacyl-ACP synthase III family protein [Amnibacterium kyonggiense]|uniref:3-oxoacyl-[acyl-carrier-protein] synthase-3 n=1 Tax=Amnibacterium kyonggiense TaxID=595671 RepID=A0A4R7FGY4_9MICO|nr:ketoacyl-ACP synthase III [Amnibacterium kyonggiense]TDS74880.1 3-oxoacyl-[acyl-carrier-protein] synthase-3 [Amnibacterium kyonggiense]
MPARIAGIAGYLPSGTLTNADLAARFPEWSVDKIAGKTGIDSRHVAAPDQTTSDLAIAAGLTLLARDGIDPASVDHLIVCTQTADYVMPATSLLVHHALGLRSSAGATDITHGCSGYVYGLGLAAALIDSGQASTVLLITADTYTRLINDADKSVRTLFGDGAAATLVVAAESPGIHSFVYGSDGSGAESLVVPGGGLGPAGRFPAADPASRGLDSNGYDLYMDGTAVFNFAIRVVPETAQAVLAKAGWPGEQVDSWVLHQANAFMLNHLRRKLGVPADRFVVELGDTGNTVSSSIPLAIEAAREKGVAAPGTRSVLIGFGVGLSWAGMAVDW